MDHAGPHESCKNEQDAPCLGITRMDAMVDEGKGQSPPHTSSKLVEAGEGTKPDIDEANPSIALSPTAGELGERVVTRKEGYHASMICLVNTEGGERAVTDIDIACAPTTSIKTMTTKNREPTPTRGSHESSVGDKRVLAEDVKDGKRVPAYQGRGMGCPPVREASRPTLDGKLQEAGISFEPNAQHKNKAKGRAMLDMLPGETRQVLCNSVHGRPPLCNLERLLLQILPALPLCPDGRRPDQLVSLVILLTVACLYGMTSVTGFLYEFAAFMVGHCPLSYSH